MTDDDNAVDTIPVTVRVPRYLVDWLKEKQAAHARDGLRVSIPTLINQSLDRTKRDETPGRPSEPKRVSRRT